MNLIKIYESILKYCGLISDSDGFISTNLDDRKEPAVIDGKRMVLPLDTQLRHMAGNDKIIFHPLTENILRGESEIITKLKQVINIKLNYTIGIVVQSLLNLVASPELHSGLNQEQAELLLNIKDCDEKTVTQFIQQMVAGIKSKPDRLFVNIYLKRGGTHLSKRFSRVGVVTFPFYQELIEDKIEKLRIKDKASYKEIFNFILPGIDDSENYNYGSNSQVAPYIDSLLKSSSNIASRLNDILLTYKEYIDEYDKLLFDADWLQAFENLDALLPEIRKIPVQFGNDGTMNVVEQQPVQQYVQPVPPVQNQQQYVPPQQQYQPPVQVIPQGPELRYTKKGLDFNSIMQTNAAVAYAPNALQNAMIKEQQQRMMQMNNLGYQQQIPPGYQLLPNGQIVPIQPMGYQQQQIPPGYQLLPNGQIVPIQPVGYPYR